jgi:hypothetical protein
VASVDSLVDGGSRIMATHQSLDGDHVAPCSAYIARYCGACADDLRWSIEYVGRSLGEAHAYLAEEILRHAE